MTTRSFTIPTCSARWSARQVGIRNAEEAHIVAPHIEKTFELALHDLVDSDEGNCAVVRVQRNIGTIATNVPGPPAPMYLCGRRMIAAYPFAPIAVRIQIAIWSYCGTLSIGITGDRDGTTDLDTHVGGITGGFGALLTETNATAP